MNGPNSKSHPFSKRIHPIHKATHPVILIILSEGTHPCRRQSSPRRGHSTMHSRQGIHPSLFHPSHPIREANYPLILLPSYLLIFLPSNFLIFSTSYPLTFSKALLAPRSFYDNIVKHFPEIDPLGLERIFIIGLNISFFGITDFFKCFWHICVKWRY